MNLGNMPAGHPGLERQNAVFNFFAPMPLQRMNAFNPARQPGGLQRQNAVNPARNLVPVAPFAAVVPENPKPIINTVNTVSKNIQNNNTKKKRRRSATRKGRRKTQSRK